MWRMDILGISNSRQRLWWTNWKGVTNESELMLLALNHR